MTLTTVGLGDLPISRARLVHIHVAQGTSTAYLLLAAASELGDGFVTNIALLLRETNYVLLHDSSHELSPMSRQACCA